MNEFEKPEEIISFLEELKIEDWEEGWHQGKMSEIRDLACLGLRAKNLEMFSLNKIIKILLKYDEIKDNYPESEWQGKSVLGFFS